MRCGAPTGGAANHDWVSISSTRLLLLLLADAADDAREIYAGGWLLRDRVFDPRGDPRRSLRTPPGHSDARGPRGTHFTSPRIVTMADPAIRELKHNAMILGAWIAAICIAPYVCHAVQGALSK